MEPRKNESQKTPEPRKEEQQHKCRFRIVKLEERIAPKGGSTKGKWCHN
jgi:hypothetical protein